MDIIDAMVLDIQTLQYLPRTLIAALFYLIIGKELNQFKNEIIYNEFPYTSTYLIDNDFIFNFIFGNFTK